MGLDEKPDFKLLDGERLSSTWIRVEAYVAHRIEVLQKANERDLDERETAKNRGRIQELRVLLGLAKVSPHTDTTRNTPDSSLGL